MVEMVFFKYYYSNFIQVNCLDLEISVTLLSNSVKY